MERNLPGVRFIDDEEKDRNSENVVTSGTSSAASVVTPRTITVLSTSVPQSAPSTTPIISVATPRTEAGNEPLIMSLLRQSQSNNVPEAQVAKKIKVEEGTSAEPSTTSTAASSSSAGQSLTDFVDKFDTYKPTIPDSVVQHYMQTAGLSTSDLKVTRLIALASQKYISDIVNDAFHFSQTQKDQKPSDKKTVLTLDVLKPVLGEFGVKVKKPSYIQ